MGEGGDSQNSNLNQGILRHWLPDNLIPLAKKIFTFLNRGGGGVGGGFAIANCLFCQV